MPCLNCWVFDSECRLVFSDRRQTAEKQAEKVERTVCNLKAALASKEKELHDQHEELVRLRRAEDALVQAEAIECERLRILADSLVCKSLFRCWVLCLLPPFVVIFVAWCSLYGCECDGSGCIGVR